MELGVGVFWTYKLQNATPVSYTEVREKRTNKEDDLLGPLVGEGLRPEIYTEEHEKLLGTCGSTWDLFVDGYTKDGKFLESVSGTMDAHLRYFKQGYELLHQMEPYINQPGFSRVTSVLLWSVTLRGQVFETGEAVAIKKVLQDKRYKTENSKLSFT
ncbi:hypothetical protein IFM89_001542 [Coptis chinensis]|uniref:Uncharacterized protein n=1 Tax=Coptis chinensis TaxID=261450 RepID=A0A835HAB7_9MAGN|nr:hypothetical protein IFM89_001542 [Coptis chinensis]